MLLEYFVFEFLVLRSFRLQVAGNEKPSILICFASKTSNAGQISSKLHVIELGAQPGTLFICFHFGHVQKCSVGEPIFTE